MPHLLIGPGDASTPWKSTEPERAAYFLDASIARQLEDELSLPGSRSEAEESSADMPLSAEAQAALESAVVRANGGTVTALHILFGIVSNENERSSHWLVQHGISREQLEQAIRSAPSPSPNPQCYSTHNKAG